MPPTPGSDDRDWTDSVVDTVESVVLTVKEKTTVPLTTAARAVVYGTLIAVVGIVLLIVVVIALIRLIDVYLLVHAGRPHGQVRLWIAYVGLGILFSLGGFFCWSKRQPKESR
jgi:hypothetical protein